MPTGRRLLWRKTQDDNWCGQAGRARIPDGLEALFFPATIRIGRNGMADVI